MALLLVLVLLPLASGRLWRSPVPAESLAAVAFACRFAGALCFWSCMRWRPAASRPGDWLVLDPLGKVFLLFVSVLFLLCGTYTATYLARGQERSNRVFCTCQLLSLAMMTLVILSHHLGLMWVAMEATTLAMAPNIYYYRTARSLEATWKYLLICSVGIALALLGSFFLAYALLHAGPALQLAAGRPAAPGPQSGPAPGCTRPLS